MPSLANVRNRVDTILANHWPNAQARQAAYFARTGKYWQGLRTATIPPSHTTAAYFDLVPDRYTSRPTDQAETWAEAFAEIENLAIPMAITMDVYQAPAGWGYVATVEARYNGTLYRRSQNVGAETGRTVAWHVVDESERL
jgi:hypothetical protein